MNYKYDIKIEYFNRRTEKNLFYEFIEKNNDCDLIHFLNRRTLLLMATKEFKDKVKNNNMNVEEYISNKKNKISTAVYDHIDLDQEGIMKLKPIYNQYTNMYYTSTKKLFEIYSSIEELKKPDAMVHDICNEKIFIPINLERF